MNVVVFHKQTNKKKTIVKDFYFEVKEVMLFRKRESEGKQQIFLLLCSQETTGQASRPHPISAVVSEPAGAPWCPSGGSLSPGLVSCRAAGMSVLSSKALHEQLSVIMGALTKAAVAEICEVVDEGYAVLQMEISRSHKENEDLRKKLHLIESIVVRGSCGGKTAEPGGGGGGVVAAAEGAKQAETPQQQRGDDGGDTAASGGGDGGAAVVLREEVNTHPAWLQQYLR